MEHFTEQYIDACHVASDLSTLLNGSIVVPIMDRH